MRSVKEVIGEYDSSKEGERKKIILIEWFQQHPGERFDRMEVYRELGDELDVGQKRVGDYLEELEDDAVLESYGGQRISYWLAEDIIIPVKYQVRAGLRHLYAIFDIKRWGIAGFVVVSTAIWTLLTLPFWFFSAVLMVSPRNHIGPIQQSEITIFAIGMTAWLLIFIILSYVLYRARRWWVFDIT
ncbi:hypothetical protein ACFQH6_20615 [Halobacteriaceae archaeon GCM10025711]